MTLSFFRKKTTLASSAMLCIWLVSAVVYFFSGFREVSFAQPHFDRPGPPLRQNDELKQSFPCPDGEINGIELRFGTYGRKIVGAISGEFYVRSGHRDQKRVFTVLLEDIRDNHWFEIPLPGVTGHAGDSCELILRCTEVRPGNEFTLWINSNDEIPGLLHINRVVQTGDLAFRTTTRVAGAAVFASIWQAFPGSGYQKSILAVGILLSIILFNVAFFLGCAGIMGRETQ